MIAAGSKIPNIGHWRNFPGSRKTSLLRASRVRAIMTSALVVPACLLVQGCGNSGTKAVANGDTATTPVSAKGDMLLPRAVHPAAAAQPTFSFADRYSPSSFADRYAAAGNFIRKPAAQAKEDRVRTDSPASYRVASLSPELPYAAPGIKQPQTQLIGFENSAFPYSGKQGSRYSDNRVLVHVPTGFDVRKPGVILVFFHGHGATLERDVRDRQLLPKQVSESATNAVLVAPQLAYDAADSSAGKFWERGGLKRFMTESAERLADVYGDPRTVDAFEKMPVVIVAYSGGFVAAASSLQVGGLGSRIKGVVLLDALYGEIDKYASWIVNNRSGFFISAYTHGTKRHDDELVRILTDKGIPVEHELDGKLKPGTVAFLPTGEGIRHRDYVTLSWTEHPIKDVLLRIPRS